MPVLEDASGEVISSADAKIIKIFVTSKKLVSIHKYSYCRLLCWSGHSKARVSFFGGVDIVRRGFGGAKDPN